MEAQKAIEELLDQSGVSVQFLTLPKNELEALYDAAESVEAAQAITNKLVAERRALAELHPDARFPGTPTIALSINLLTAVTCMQRVAEREASVAQEAGEEDRIQHIRETRDLVIQELDEELAGVA